MFYFLTGGSHFVSFSFFWVFFYFLRISVLLLFLFFFLISFPPLPVPKVLLPGFTEFFLVVVVVRVVPSFSGFYWVLPSF